jgi:hypothetical protein
VVSVFCGSVGNGQIFLQTFVSKRPNERVLKVTMLRP